MTQKSQILIYGEVLENGKSRETITITNIGETRHSGWSNVMTQHGIAPRPVVDRCGIVVKEE